MGKGAATALVTVSYVVALAAGVFTLGLVDGHDVWRLFAADFVATLVIFAFSMAFGNSSFYDAYWSVVPPVLAAFWLGQPEAVGGPVVGRQVLVVGLLTLWAARLTANWWRGWSGLHHEDWRYVDLARQTGKAWPLVSLLGIHLFPTVQVFAACLPLWVVLAQPGPPLGPLDALAALVTLAAIAVEHVGDEQLRVFRASGPAPEAVMDTGVWSWSRHPNYLGEVGFWWGLWGFAMAVDPSSWWTGVGALAITAMFVWISIPLIEKRMRERRPGYAEVQRRVSMLLPRPPRAPER